jgi:hypothetical protein
MGMLEAKPPSPGSSGASGAATHIHAHQRWAAPLLASVLLSSLFFSSSPVLLLSFSPLPSSSASRCGPRSTPCRASCPGSPTSSPAPRETEPRCVGRLGRSTTWQTCTSCTSISRLPPPSALSSPLPSASTRLRQVPQRQGRQTDEPGHLPWPDHGGQYAARGCHPAARGRRLCGGRGLGIVGECGEWIAMVAARFAEGFAAARIPDGWVEAGLAEVVRAEERRGRSTLSS